MRIHGSLTIERLRPGNTERIRQSYDCLSMTAPYNAAAMNKKHGMLADDIIATTLLRSMNVDPVTLIDAINEEDLTSLTFRLEPDHEGYINLNCKAGSELTDVLTPLLLFSQLDDRLIVKLGNMLSYEKLTDGRCSFYCKMSIPRTMMHMENEPLSSIIDIPALNSLDIQIKHITWSVTGIIIQLKMPGLQGEIIGDIK